MKPKIKITCSINPMQKERVVIVCAMPLIFTLLLSLSGCEKEKDSPSANSNKNNGNITISRHEPLWEKGELFSVNGEKLELIKVLLPWQAENDIHRAKEYYENVFPYITALALSNDGSYLAWGDWSENLFVWDEQRDIIITVNDSTISRPKFIKQEKHEADMKRLHDYYTDYVLEHGREPSEEESMRQFDIIAHDPNFINTKPNTPTETIKSIRFTKNNELYWLAGNRYLWHTHIRENKAVDKKKINQDNLIGFSGIITDDSLILCRSVDRNALLMFFRTPKYELRKYDLLLAQYEKTCKIYPPNPKKGFHEVEHMSLSSDGTLLAIASNCNSGIVRLKDFKLIRTLNIEYVTGMGFSGDNSRIALGIKDNIVKVLNAEDGRLIYEYVWDFYEPEYFFFENNEVLWMVSSDKLYRINIMDGNIELFWNGSPIHVMISDIDRRRLYFGCRDGTVRVFGLPRKTGK